jgi:hypothetical protein
MSLTTLARMMDEAVTQLIRAEQLESEGRIEEARGIISEWENYSALNVMNLSVDCFVRN